MRSLIIDTSTERGIIALTDQNQVLFEKQLPFGHQQSKHLMPELSNLIQNKQLNEKAVDCIAVGVGPGSYTGIRVGVSVAKTFAYAWKLPLIGFCSLEAFVPQQIGLFAALIDAKIGGVYVLKGYFDGVLTRNVEQVQAIPLHQLNDYLKEVTTIVTPSSQSLKKKLDELYPQCHWEWQENSPNAAVICQIVQQKYQRKEWSENTQLELMYLRKTEAELEKERKSSGSASF